MTLPADDRPPVTPEGDLAPRAPEPGWSPHQSPITPEPLTEDPAFRDPASIPTTEVEPIPTPGSTAHRPGAAPGSTPGEPSALRPARPRMFTRTSAAWLGVWAGVLVVILLIIFIGQNTADVRIRFLWLDGQIPTALALLIAGVGGAIIAMAVAAARIVQLRRLVRRRRRN